MRTRASLFAHSETLASHIRHICFFLKSWATQLTSVWRQYRPNSEAAIQTCTTNKTCVCGKADTRSPSGSWNLRLFWAGCNERVRHRRHGDVPHAKIQPGDSDLFADVDNAFYRCLNLIDTWTLSWRRKKEKNKQKTSSNQVEGCLSTLLLRLRYSRTTAYKRDLPLL